MALTITINEPTATDIGGVYGISVEAVAMDKNTEVARATFSTTCSESADPKGSASGAYDQAAKAIAEQILHWRKGLDRLAAYMPMLAELKKRIEGLVN